MSTQSDYELPDPIEFPFSLPLARPVHVGEETISTLEFRKITLVDLDELPLDTAALRFKDLRELGRRLSSQPRHVIDALEGIDGANLCQVAVAAMRPYLARETGG